MNEWGNLARRTETRALVQSSQTEPGWLAKFTARGQLSTAAGVNSAVLLEGEAQGWALPTGPVAVTEAAWRPAVSSVRESSAPVPPSERPVHPMALKCRFRPLISRKKKKKNYAVVPFRFTV